MSDHQLLDRLQAEGLDPGAWSNGPGERYAPHAHAYDKVIVVASGSIDFDLPARGERIGLATGDRLELPAGVEHDATVGPEGVACFEAHLPTGAIAAARHLPAGAW
jgi:quercetin dioxygenase-like cupin family protein